MKKKNKKRFITTKMFIEQCLAHQAKYAKEYKRDKENRKKK